MHLMNFVNIWWPWKKWLTFADNISDAFSWMKIWLFGFKFQWILFPRTTGSNSALIKIIPWCQTAWKQAIIWTNSHIDYWHTCIDLFCWSILDNQQGSTNFNSTTTLLWIDKKINVHSHRFQTPTQLVNHSGLLTQVNELDNQWFR